MVLSSKSISGLREESSSSSSSSGRRRETNIDENYETPQNISINDILDGGPYLLYIKGLIKTDDFIIINQSFYVDENGVKELPGWQQSSEKIEINATLNQVDVNVTVAATVSLQIKVHLMTNS